MIALLHIWLTHPWQWIVAWVLVSPLVAYCIGRALRSSPLYQIQKAKRRAP